MKGLLTITAALSLVVSEASAHYIFQQFSVGSRKYGVYEHIRKNTNYNSPVTSLSSNDLRCNEGGLTGGNTTVVDIRAGDSFTFTSDQEVYHQGPVSLFLSKAPGSVSNYQGDGGWIKFFDWGPTFGSGQPVWPLRSTYTQTIPRCIPNGEYLLRIQSLAIHNPGGIPQFYISCAQIRVSGGGSANLDSSSVRIPGVFKATDPGYTANIWNGLKSYTVPGGPVWTCP